MFNTPQIARLTAATAYMPVAHTIARVRWKRDHALLCAHRGRASGIGADLVAMNVRVARSHHRRLLRLLAGG